MGRIVGGAVTTPSHKVPVPLEKRQVQSPLNSERIVLLDPSELYRPEKGKDFESFRAFEDSSNPHYARVLQTYKDMHTQQTVEFVKQKREHYLKFNHAEQDIMTALESLYSVIDESDPDVDVPNIVHAFQTAERIRQLHPQEDWFHLVGLIHDLGKVMAVWGEKHFAVCGDTFAVGCAPGDSVAHKSTTFGHNPDMQNPLYNTKYGMYKPNCGLKNLLLSWGHDEYLYQVLKNHSLCTLPEEGLNIIRFHSFYPWHMGGDYWHLASEEDKNTFYWIKEFNKFDLYSKADFNPDISALKPYYQSLIEKYIPGEVKF